MYVDQYSSAALQHSADYARADSAMCVQEDVLAGDKATDVLACGTVLFAMLTARPPSHNSGTQERTSGASSEAADDEVAGKLVWPDSTEISDSCKNLLEAMLSPHSAERPTIHQVLDHPWCVLFASTRCPQASLQLILGSCLECCALLQTTSKEHTE